MNTPDENLTGDEIENRRFEEHLNVLRASGGVRPSPPCPEEEELADVAAGTVSPAAAERVLAHIEGCEACGARFKGLSECFSDELTQEDAELLAMTRTSQLSWQSEFAKRSAPPRPARETMFRFPVRRLAWIAVPIVVFVVAVWWWTNRYNFGGTGTEKLLAQAYTGQRPFELRLPGAHYAPLKVERGARGRRPEPLLEAELQIRRQLSRAPDDPHWLDLEARADLLERDPAAGVEELERAVTSSAPNPVLLADLATAYTLRAEGNGSPSDLARAADLLSRSLRLRPGAADVLFNRALVYESLKADHEAIEAWKAYLASDSSSGWAQEARLHLDRLLKKKRESRP